MLKVSSHCSICKLPASTREELHTDKWINHFTGKQLAAKFFPNRAEKAVLRSCTKHFKFHFPFDQFVNDIVAAKTLIVGNVPAVTAIERSIFTDAVREQINSIKTIENMMKTLMERGNYLQEEWSNIHAATKCATCGRDETGPNLVKILAVFRELREQADLWTKVRNPMAVVGKIAEQTFITFVEEMTDVYVLILSEKARLIKEAANDFFAGKINQAVFIKRITETVDDFGGDRISGAAQEKFQRILSAATKELKL